MTKILCWLIACTFSLTSLAQKTERDYWLETQLSFDQMVGDALTNLTCYAEERTFRGCLSGLFAGLRHLPNQEGSGVLPGDGGVLPGFKVVTTDTPADYRARAITAWTEVQPPRLRPSFEAAFAALKRLLPPAEISWVTANMVNSFLGIAVDPHTHLEPAALSEVVSQGSRTTGLYGLTFRFVEEDQRTLMVVESIMRGSSAAEKIFPGDLVMSINGVSGTAKAMFETLAASQSATFVVENSDGQRTVQITRRQLETRNVEMTYLTSPAGRHVGLIRLGSFMSNESCRDVKRAGERLLKMGAESIILDLRFNGGGRVDQGACLIALFVEDNSLTWRMFLTHGNTGEELRRSSSMPRLFQDIPTATLINGSSASASELTAGYLKAYGKSWIVGERSFGKGTMQRVSQLPENPRVLFASTQAMFYGPDGVSPQLRGVEPDFTVYPNVGQTASTPFRREADLFPEAIPNEARAPANPALVERKQRVQVCLQREEAVAQAIAQAGVYERRVIDTQALTAMAVLDCQHSEGVENYRETNIPALPMPGVMKLYPMEVPRSW